jgi:hypothetical protein
VPLFTNSLTMLPLAVTRFTSIGSTTPLPTSPFYRCAFTGREDQSKVAGQLDSPSRRGDGAVHF